MERRVQALFKHLKPHATCFWAETAGEDFINQLRVSGSRWLSLLCPLEKRHQSYLTILGHLHFEFKHVSDKEQQKTIEWVFLFLSTWQFRLTMSAVIDILRVCFKYKNILESSHTMDEVLEISEQLRLELSGFAQKSSEAMSQEHPELPGGTTVSEETCRLRLSYLPTSQPLCRPLRRKSSGALCKPPSLATFWSFWLQVQDGTSGFTDCGQSFCRVLGHGRQQTCRGDEGPVVTRKTLQSGWTQMPRQQSFGLRCWQAAERRCRLPGKSLLATLFLLHRLLPANAHSPLCGNCRSVWASERGRGPLLPPSHLFLWPLSRRCRKGWAAAVSCCGRVLLTGAPRCP